MSPRPAAASCLHRPGTLALLLVACSRPPPVAEADPAPSAASTFLDGERVLSFPSQGAPGAAESIPLGHYLGPGHVHGLAHLPGEVGVATFDGGTLWVSERRDGRDSHRRVDPGAPYGGHAATLQVAQITAWTGSAVGTGTDMDQLAGTVRARAHDYAATAAVPFRVEDGARYLVGILHPVEGQDQVHLHVIEGDRTAHIDSVRLTSSARLQLPVGLGP